MKNKHYLIVRERSWRDVMTGECSTTYDIAGRYYTDVAARAELVAQCVPGLVVFARAI